MLETLSGGNGSCLQTGQDHVLIQSNQDDSSKAFMGRIVQRRSTKIGTHHPALTEESPKRMLKQLGCAEMIEDGSIQEL